MNAPNTPFVAYPLRFELQAIDPIYLHAHNGSALRGMPDPPSDRWRCAACEFRRFCNDI